MSKREVWVAEALGRIVEVSRYKATAEHTAKCFRMGGHRAIVVRYVPAPTRKRKRGRK